MKIALTIVLMLAIAVSGYFYFLGKASRKGASPGLVSQKLAPCASELNCVCSEYEPGKDSYFSPIKITGVNAASIPDACVADPNRPIGT